MLLFEAPTRELYGSGDVVWRVPHAPTGTSLSLLHCVSFPQSLSSLPRADSFTAGALSNRPATLALARLLIHCPSFVAGLNILELGAGLGLPSCAAAAAGARSVTVTDYDAELLLFARRSVAMNLAPDPGCVINAVRADWTRLPGDWPSLPCDLLIASDVLYNGALAADVAAVIAHYLIASRPPGSVLPRALVADPKQRENRDVFAAKCASLGLDCQVTDLPGPEDCSLLCVTPASS